MREPFNLNFEAPGTNALPEGSAYTCAALAYARCQQCTCAQGRAQLGTHGRDTARQYCCRPSTTPLCTSLRNLLLNCSTQSYAQMNPASISIDCWQADSVRSACKRARGQHVEPATECDTSNGQCQAAAATHKVGIAITHQLQQAGSVHRYAASMRQPLAARPKAAAYCCRFDSRPLPSAELGRCESRRVIPWSRPAPCMMSECHWILLPSTDWVNKGMEDTIASEPCSRFRKGQATCASAAQDDVRPD